jgi:hypothetical protein
MRMPRVLDLAGWAFTVVVAAGWLALVEVFWLPLRVAGVLFPVSVAVAVVGNLLLTGWAFRLSGSRAVAVLPGVTWIVVAVGAMSRRPEGDLVIVGQGALGAVGLSFLLLGVLSAAVGVGRMLGSAARPRVRPVPENPDPHRAGSGSGGAR